MQVLQSIFQIPRKAHPRRAFTLIEILVAVTIILILAGVLIALTSNVRAKAQISHTKVTLTALQGIMDDYLRENPPLPNTFDGPGTNTVNPSWIVVLKNFPTYRAQIEKLQSESLSGTNTLSAGSNIPSVIDAWRRPIEYRASAPGSGRPGFISSGPDVGNPTDDLSSGEK